MTDTDELVKGVARAWASIDGKPYEAAGCNEGYDADAKELLERSGLLDTIKRLQSELDAVNDSNAENMAGRFKAEVDVSQLRNILTTVMLRAKMASLDNDDTYNFGWMVLKAEEVLQNTQTMETPNDPE